MRNLLYVSALVTLVGCLNEEKFGEKYAEKYCEEWAKCNTTAECPVTAGGTADATGTCDFDKAKAKECLDGTYTCNDEFPGIEFVVSPTSCLEVCGAGGDTDGGGDTDAAM